ncbi:hypothetical protein J2752_002331 [Halarchaeum rubridurum]|uniref:Uncharacterized protein n=1 Tax=Halarchaeum rubridurum TaxID=489911 RepID=A0A8T4GQ25_9EURY|nr:hypothetical protein [Halarchaeum rubridurum]
MNLTDLASVDDVDAYLEEHDAKQAEFLKKQIDRA